MPTRDFVRGTKGHLCDDVIYRCGRCSSVLVDFADHPAQHRLAHFACRLCGREPLPLALPPLPPGFALARDFERKVLPLALALLAFAMRERADRLLADLANHARFLQCFPRGGAM